MESESAETSRTAPTDQERERGSFKKTTNKSEAKLVKSDIMS